MKSTFFKVFQLSKLKLRAHYWSKMGWPVVQVHHPLAGSTKNRATQCWRQWRWSESLTKRSHPHDPVPLLWNPYFYFLPQIHRQKQTLIKLHKLHQSYPKLKFFHKVEFIPCLWCFFSYLLGYYRTQANLGSDLWVRMSVRHNLQDVCKT